MGNPAGVSRDFDALEKRRFEAVRLFERGLKQSEIARQLRVVPQTVARWVHDCGTRGMSALNKAGRVGRLPRLNEQQRQQLEKLLLRGPEQLGYETPLWTCPRVANLIEQEFGVSYHEGHVWKILVSLDWSPQQPEGRARERNEEHIRNWKKKEWPRLKLFGRSKDEWPQCLHNKENPGVPEDFIRFWVGHARRARPTIKANSKTLVSSPKSGGKSRAWVRASVQKDRSWTEWTEYRD